MASDEGLFEKMFRARFGRGPTPEEVKVLIDQSVTSYNQSGGITAHTVNLGKPHRTLSSPDGEMIKREILKQNKAVSWAVCGIMGDMESVRFAGEIRAFMANNGFSIAKDGMISCMPREPFFGLQVWPPTQPGDPGARSYWTIVVGGKP